jgi:hypothetical protein
MIFKVCEVLMVMALSLRSVLQLLLTAKVTITLILFTLMMEAIRFSETSVLTRASRHHIPEDDIL